MAVLQTQRISICALKSCRKQILEELQRSGNVQIEERGKEDSVFKKTDTTQARMKYERRMRDAESALEVLDTYAPEKKGLLSSLEGIDPISEEQYYDNVDQRHEINEKINRLNELNRIIAEGRADKVRSETTIESLQPWMSLDVPMDLSGTRSTSVILGAMPGEWTLDQILSQIAKAHPELDAYEVEVLGSDRDQTCIFAVCPQIDEPILEDALRVNGFVRPTFQSQLMPEDYEKELKEQIASSEKLEQDSISEIQSLADWREKIRFAADYYRMRVDKYQVIGELLQSGHAFFVNGFVPKDQAQKLKEKLESEYTCEVEITDVKNPAKAPVLLKNNAFVSPTESVVESFGLPGKGEIDPTEIMAIFYYVFFGLMLSDAGYGILMVLVCGFILWKYKNMKPGTKNFITMFFWCGVSTTIWGILFGGYFGDIVSVFSSTFLHKTVTVPAVWMTPLDDPMRLLMYCFLFGLIHLFVGLGIKGYMDIREKKYLDLFANEICWFLLIAGLILLLLPTQIFGSMYGSMLNIPSVFTPISIVMAIVGALGILFFEEHRRKSMGMRILVGAYDLYGISSWLSDLLSYSRLLALGLATGVIASVINTMAGMVAGVGPVAVGFILFWLVFVVGHALNMAINLLGAYVHTNRLQYVEFFGKFYEGGGRPFIPFSASNNKYFKFKEE